MALNSLLYQYAATETICNFPRVHLEIALSVCGPSIAHNKHFAITIIQEVVTADVDLHHSEFRFSHGYRCQCGMLRRFKCRPSKVKLTECSSGNNRIDWLVRNSLILSALRQVRVIADFIDWRKLQTVGTSHLEAKARYAGYEFAAVAQVR